MNNLRYTTILVFVIFGYAQEAFALQTHGPPEGIYVHQMAHVLFTTSLLYLYWHTRRTQEITGRGWKYFQLFCLFLVFWNILAVVGHEVTSHLGSGDFLAKDTWEAKLAPPVTALKIVYYITKMDHFFIVPALVSLVASLRSLYLEAKRGGAQ